MSDMGRPVGSTTYDHDKIVRLWRIGVPSAAIAQRMGCTQRTVNRVVRDHEKGGKAC